MPNKGVASAIPRRRSTKRLDRFDHRVRRGLPYAAAAARRAVYEDLVARFGFLIVSRHVDSIAAVLDRSELRAVMQPEGSHCGECLAVAGADPTEACGDQLPPLARVTGAGRAP